MCVCFVVVLFTDQDAIQTIVDKLPEMRERKKKRIEKKKTNPRSRICHTLKQKKKKIATTSTLHGIHLAPTSPERKTHGKYITRL